MKKNFSLFVVIVFLFVVGACKKQPEPIPIVNNKVTLELNGGVTSGATIIEAFDGHVILPTPTKEDNIFIGWTASDGTPFYDDSIVTSSMTIYANWTKANVQYRIFYSAEGVTFPEEYVNRYISGEGCLLPIVSKKHHEFIGWTVNEDLSSPTFTELTTTDYGNKTLYPVFRDIAEYEDITYHLDGGILSDSAITKVIVGETYKLDAPTKVGCYFKGYYQNSDFSGERISVIDASTPRPLVLYARFVEAKLENALISVYGDSISTYLGYIPAEYAHFYPVSYNDVQDVNDTWWQKAINDVGATFCSNASWSGSRVAGGGFSSGTNPDRIANLASETDNPDIILVYIGVNDCSSSITLANFQLAYRTMINNMKKQYPNCEIIICNLPYTRYGDTRLELKESYNEFLLEFANELNLPLVDIASKITSENMSTYLADGTHPNKLGMSLIASLVVDALKK